MVGVGLNGGRHLVPHNFGPFPLPDSMEVSVVRRQVTSAEAADLLPAARDIHGLPAKVSAALVSRILYRLLLAKKLQPLFIAISNCV